MSVFIPKSVLSLFDITAVGVVTCCDPKKSPCTSFIVQIPFGLLRSAIEFREIRKLLSV